MATSRDARRIWEELKFQGNPQANKPHAVFCPLCNWRGTIFPAGGKLVKPGAFIEGEPDAIRPSTYAVPCPGPGCHHRFEIEFLYQPNRG